jgi:hypothetical protein
MGVVRGGSNRRPSAFQEFLRSQDRPEVSSAPTPSRPHFGWSELTSRILPAVPSYTEVCRLACGKPVGNSVPDPEL